MFLLVKKIPPLLFSYRRKKSVRADSSQLRIGQRAYQLKEATSRYCELLFGKLKIVVNWKESFK